MKDPQNKYRYAITNRLGTLQAAPLGESNFLITWSRADGGNLDYKQELPSKITFYGAVFARLKKLEQSIYRCEFQQLTVERNCISGNVSTWLPWFSGRMSLNDGLWDLDKCNVEIKLDDVKAGECIEAAKGTEINLFDFIPSRRTVLLNDPTIIIEKVTYSETGGPTSDACRTNDIWGGAGSPYAQGYGVYFWDHSVSRDPAGDICTTQTGWAREILLTNCADPAPGTDWILVEDTCPGGGKKYARPPRLYGCIWVYPDYGAPLEVSSLTCKIVGDTASAVSIDNGMSLPDVINAFLSHFCPGFTFVSDFFQINPDVVSSINYVTGQRSKTRFITFFQKSDVKRPAVSGNATKALLSFDKFLDNLVKMFNLKWRIDGNILRLEHVSFFQRAPGLDLTLPRYAKAIAGKRKYSYEQQEIPAREDFKFMEAGPGDFAGVPIRYSGGCIAQASRSQVKTYTVENFTTDVELAINNPDPDSKIVDDEGFIIAACDFDGSNYYMISEGQILGGGFINNSLGWAQLHRDYYKHDRPLSSGIMNNVQTDFITVKPTKKGDSITIPLCCGDSFDPYQTITTPLGVGTVDKATFSFKDETLKVDLLYPADAGLVTNLRPTAGNDTATTYHDTPVTINILSNDADADGVLMSVVIVISPLHGSVVVNPNLTVTYTPAAGYEGDDYFIYKVLDDWGESSANALVAITVRPTNAPPLAVDDSYTTNLNTALIVAAPGIFGNDSDDVSFALNTFDASSVHGGTVAVNSNGSFTYTPATGYTGPDSFTYSIIDGGGLSDSATVRIEVRNPLFPVANDDTYTTRRNTNLIQAAPGLLLNDTTPAGTLTAVAGTFATAQGGSVTIATNGGFVYTPPAGYVGLDSFIYTADNGSGTDTAVATINVFPDLFLKLEKVADEINNITIRCGDPAYDQYGGTSKSAFFRARFYQNSGGTVPADVTGLGLRVFFRVSGVYFVGGPYTYVNDEEATGTERVLFFGVKHEYFRDEVDCSNNPAASINESIVLEASPLYTII